LQNSYITSIPNNDDWQFVVKIPNVKCAVSSYTKVTPKGEWLSIGFENGEYEEVCTSFALACCMIDAVQGSDTTMPGIAILSVKNVALL
jgi:hypothetical protein